MGTRNNTSRKGSGRETYAVVVDGETEMWYLHMLKRNEPGLTIAIRPELPKKKTLKEQYASVKENADQYDKSIWIIDLDTIIRESRERTKGKDKIIAELKDYLNEVKGNNRIQIIINTPCLEFWFLLHVKSTSKYFPQCSSVNQELKKFEPLKSYEKTEKYFTSKANDIYKRLKQYQQIACRNATSLGDFDIHSPETAKSEMSRLIDLLGINK